MLPKLRPDRTAEVDRPTAAAAKVGPAVKLPRIPTRDVRPESEDCGVGRVLGNTRLAKLQRARPQSTGGSSSGGGPDSGVDRKLAYFRANSAPKFHSQYLRNCVLSSSATTRSPERGLSTTSRSPEHDRSATPASSDTADTALDVLFVQQHQQPVNDNEGAVAEATAATTTTMTSTTTTTSGTRTVSTSTCTTFAEPVFPIVFSCESVLRHPLDGGYVSHTESHRFSVHYVPAERIGAVAATETDEGSRSSLVFSSASACPNEQCFTGDSMSVTLADSSAPPSTSASTPATADERRPDVSGQLPLSSGSLDDHEQAETDGKNASGNRDCNNAVRIEGVYVLGRGDAVSECVNTYEKATEIVPTLPANKIIDALGADGREVDELKSHAHTDDMPLLQLNGQNYERLTQNHQVHPDRTVSNQSPKPQSTESRLLQQNDSIPAENNTHAIGLELPRTDNTEPTWRPTEPSRSHASDVESTRFSTDLIRSDASNVEPTRRPIVVESKNRSVEDIVPEKRSAEVTVDRPDGLTENPSDSSCSDPADPLENPYEHFADMAPHGHGHHCGTMRKRETERNRCSEACKNSCALQQCGGWTDKRRVERDRHGVRRNVPIRLYDDMSRTQDNDNGASHVGSCRVGTRLDHSFAAVKDRHRGPVRDGSEDCLALSRDQRGERNAGPEHYGTESHRSDANACYRCTPRGVPHCENGGVAEDRMPTVECHNATAIGSHGDRHAQGENGTGAAQCSVSKRRLESVDESAEAKESSCSDYVGGFLFGDAFYKKRPQKHGADEWGGGHRGDGDESDKADFPSRPDDCRYGYYRDYAPKTRHSPRDEDCTVFADVRPSRKPAEARLPRAPDVRDVDGVSRGGPCGIQRPTAAAHASSYYSQLDRGAPPCGRDDKNSDSDESLTDSLEDGGGGGGKYNDGSAVSYFLALNGRRSAAVTFTLKMPDTLENRLSRRHSLLKKHLHVSAAVTKTATRVRTRHKGCQTLWTEEKGVQVQRGSTANAGARGCRRPVVDDRRVLETLLAGLGRNRVSENQIRLVAGQKMVSEGNQTEPPAAERHVQTEPPAADRHVQTESPPTVTRDRHAHTQTCRDVAAGPETPENRAGAVAAAAGTGRGRGQAHAAKKFSSDNALMVGVVRQNKYKGREALDGACKNDQLLTLSKGWINFYTLRADSVDADTQEMHDIDDDDIRTEDDSQQYTVHVQAVPEPVTLPVVHIPHRNTLQLPKHTCSAAKHLPRLVHSENNNHQCPSNLATVNGWCVSVDGPNNVHMKVSLLPEKSDVKTSENFDQPEENKIETRKLALQRKNNYVRKPYRNMKRTQSTPRDMFSADVSRTESALSAESKYIETIDTQLLIHKARRRLSHEWDTRIKNGGVTESVQLVVTGDSVSSRASHQHYATRGHQHCSFRRQSRRI